MLKKYLEKLKDSIKIKEKGNNKKTIENLVIFVVILIITIVAINYIWNDKKTNNKNNISNSKTLALDNSSNNKDVENKDNEENIELKLEKILSNIKGVGDVKVLITYSKTSTIIPMYSEDTSQSTTQETDSGGGNRIINEISSKKDIVYEENEGVKTPVTQNIINPSIEGAIITAQGASNIEIKTDIIIAVEAATGLATHKIQVFEMK